MTFTGIGLFILSVVAGLTSVKYHWLENVAVFLFGWAAAFIMLGMIPRADRVDTDS
ncbi:hypothetical protein SEA_MOAB_232 [Streptomyces phage Moab]|nr:hypothetical protein SEA_MOAB_232 [Streptomyces phage Moab]WMI33835.1 membrane protein [Streptomyces phage Patelgo]